MTGAVGAAVAAVLAALMLVGCDPELPPERFRVGVSYTHHVAPSGVALDVLASVPVHNIHLMGWGTDNPQPAPGRFRWETLDARVGLSVRSGAEPVLTLCCAPDWMKGGPTGVTDWSRLDEAPLTERYGDFAALAAAAAVRYPEVKRFQVWNEMKGFYDSEANRWDVAGYTVMYNEVYSAVKAVRPDALVGGPYVTMDLWSDASVMSHPSDLAGPWGVVDQRSLDVVDYWLANNVGADFVAVDGWSSTRDAGWVSDPSVAVDVFRAVTEWLRARTDLPVWWSEIHVVDPSWPLPYQDAVTTLAVTRIEHAGAAAVLLWAPQAESDVCTGCLWTDPSLGPVTVTPLAATVTGWPR